MKLELELTPNQKKFVDARGVDEVLYGGAAGGGKTRGQLIDALLYALQYPNSKQLFLRRTFPDLQRSVILEHRKFYPPKVYRYNESKHLGTFANGSTLEFGYLDSAADLMQYQGAEYDVIRFDELTHFTEYMYTYLLSRVRGTLPYPRQLKSSTNPGGLGHAWVKARFIDGHVPGKAEECDDGGVKGTRLFIPSLVQDNPYIMQNDPKYIQRLQRLPEQQRKALLYGDWNIFSGQVFEEWRDEPSHYLDGLWTHVIEPFEIPAWWRIWRGFDWGYAKPFSVGWYAVDGDGKLYRIHEWYGCTREPDTGIKLQPAEIAAGIKKIENEDPNLRGKRIMGVADPAIFGKATGVSVADLMARAPNCILWTKGDNTRLAGKMQFHYRLAFDGAGRCMFQVFNTCRQFIRTVPMLVYSETRPEDIETTGEDHIYDECRYVMMENPISPRENVKREIPQEDPLDLYKDRQRDVRIIRY